MPGDSKAVFLSYASEDSEAAHRIADALRAANVEVWFDKSELRGGDTWDEKIRREIRDCALFMPLVSRNTEQRSEGYFRLEWRLAVERSHLMADDATFLLPVAIDSTAEADARVPQRFRQVQWTRAPSGDLSAAMLEHVQRALNLVLSPPDRPRPPAANRAAASDDVPDKSIAVLPFTNLAADKDTEYFGDGLAEEILNALSQVPELRVAARSSAFSFKGRSLGVADIAERLHVATVLEGSVRRAADRLRITVQLIDARTGFQLWSERYDRQMADIFEIQDEIARSVAARFQIVLAGAGTRPTGNVEAYELYIRGRYDWHRRSPATLQAAIRNFEASIRLDSNNALAYAGLADCYAVLTYFGWIPTSAALERSREAVKRATILAPDLWETSFSQALHQFTMDRNWRAALPHFERAVALAPRSALAHIYFGLYWASAGNPEAATEHCSRGLELDPLSPLGHYLACMGFATVRALDAAERAGRRAIELSPDYLGALWVLGRALCHAGRAEEAIPYFERLVQLSRSPFDVAWLVYGYGLAGRTEEGRALASELSQRGLRGEFISPVAQLLVACGLNDLPAIRAALANGLADWVPPLSILCADMARFMSDPEVARLYGEWGF
ncbi:MAG: TIR domain-containing protein [Proteobacteria bacterium]|nr:TIR domain-containing protein [Pseudomonadota bacterium]